MERTYFKLSQSGESIGLFAPNATLLDAVTFAEQAEACVRERFDRMTRWINLLTNLFPFSVLLGGVLALLRPVWFTWFSGSAIVWGLALIMLGMGMTLTLDDKALRQC